MMMMHRADTQTMREARGGMALSIFTTSVFNQPSAPIWAMVNLFSILQAARFQRQAGRRASAVFQMVFQQREHQSRFLVRLPRFQPSLHHSTIRPPDDKGEEMMLCLGDPLYFPMTRCYTPSSCGRDSSVSSSRSANRLCLRLAMMMSTPSAFIKLLRMTINWWHFCRACPT